MSRVIRLEHRDAYRLPNGREISSRELMMASRELLESLGCHAGVTAVLRGSPSSDRCAYCRGHRRDEKGACAGCGALT